MYLKKYFIPRSYLNFLTNNILPRNLIIDNIANPIYFDDLSALHGVENIILNIKGNDFKTWVNKYFSDWQNHFNDIQYKKLIEFYTTHTLLEPRPNDVFMDAAGGSYTYLNSLQCKTRIVQDINISDEFKARFGKEIEYIESNASKIGLPNESVDKISSHHSFEHFQADSDILFIKEVQRLLRVNGKCCIIPIFIANRYVDLTDTFTFKKFDVRSRRVIDPTATIPGGKTCGNYARIYDLKAFQKRVINNINMTKFKVIVAELQLDGEIVPDLTLECHKGVTVLNRPYRAMLIQRLK